MGYAGTINGTFEAFQQPVETKLPAHAEAEKKPVDMQAQLDDIRCLLSTAGSEFVGIDKKGVKGMRSYFLLKDESQPDMAMLRSIRGRLESLWSQRPTEEQNGELMELQMLTARFLRAKTITRSVRQNLNIEYGGIWSGRFDGGTSA